MPRLSKRAAETIGFHQYFLNMCVLTRRELDLP
jgi:hypothetical protein